MVTRFFKILSNSKRMGQVQAKNQSRSCLIHFEIVQKNLNLKYISFIGLFTSIWPFYPILLFYKYCCKHPYEIYSRYGSWRSL